ncbi:hypothetical protein D1007_13417 [Hordeum vulgare]|nr:hypothetical protein D1007_13417 [Hordeum vulgare]
MVRTGRELSCGPLLDRSSLLVPWLPLQFSSSRDAEFARFMPETMINPLMATSMEQHMYRIDAAGLVGLQKAASQAAVAAPYALAALCAHVSKLLAWTVNDSNLNCHMVWILEGWKCIEPSEGALDLYMGNVVTYTSWEAPAAELRRASLHEMAALRARPWRR